MNHKKLIPAHGIKTAATERRLWLLRSHSVASTSPSGIRLRSNTITAPKSTAKMTPANAALAVWSIAEGAAPPPVTLRLVMTSRRRVRVACPRRCVLPLEAESPYWGVRRT